MKRIFIKIISLFFIITVIPTIFFVYNTALRTSLSNLLVYNSSLQKTLRVSEKEYLIGSLLAQTNADFDIEMIKSQAVVIYTNTLFEKIKNKEKTFDIESNDTLYFDEMKAKNFHGEKYETLLSKIETAIGEVSGQKVTYNSQLVFLPYFYCSDGKTEDAYFVWGKEIEYLKPAISEGDSINPNLKTVYTVTLEEFKKALYDTYKLEIPDGKTPTIAIGGRTESGTVTTCTVEELTMTGQNFRSLFNLCSANFDIKTNDAYLEIICYGNGHYVGMSQYGADFLARQGHNYKEILKHYYTGIEIT